MVSGSSSVMADTKLSNTIKTTLKEHWESFRSEIQRTKIHSQLRILTLTICCSKEFSIIEEKKQRFGNAANLLHHLLGSLEKIAVLNIFINIICGDTTTYFRRLL